MIPSAYHKFPLNGPKSSQEIKFSRESLFSNILRAFPIVFFFYLLSVSYTHLIKDFFQNTIKSIDFIVIVLIVSAGLLAFVVLYNLTNINITERQKEIATIKVLGFYDKEVSAYIYRETGILTLIGTAIGLIFGIFLHAFVVKTAEVDMVMFGREIKWLSYVFSALLTIFFSIIVNLVMYRKLKKISMVESMKSTE